MRGKKGEAGVHGGWGQKHASASSMMAHSFRMGEKHLDEIHLGMHVRFPRGGAEMTALGVSAEPLLLVALSSWCGCHIWK